VWFPSEMPETDEEEPETMADTLSMALAELVREAEVEPDVDVLREGVRVLSQALMELEVAQHRGAAKHERTPERTGQRTGDRERDWDTRVGTLELRVPRGPRWVVVPEPAGAAAARRAGAGRHGARGVRAGGAYAPGGRAGQGPRPGRYLEEPG